jgi:hypothetical protein
MQAKITLAANSAPARNIRGHVFAVLAAAVTFDVELDNGGRQTMVAGRKVVGAFKRIVFYETQSVSNAITYYAGDEDITITSPTTSDGQTTNTSASDTTTTPVEGFHVFAASDTPEQLTNSATDTFKVVKVYPGTQMIPPGGLVENVNDVYVGLSATNLPESRAGTDTQFPVEIVAPVGRVLLRSRVWAQGKINEGVFFRFYP